MEIREWKEMQFSRRDTAISLTKFNINTFSSFVDKTWVWIRTDNFSFVLRGSCRTHMNTDTSSNYRQMRAVTETESHLRLWPKLCYATRVGKGFNKDPKNSSVPRDMSEYRFAVLHALCSFHIIRVYVSKAI
jgi:hypothetical protein